MSVSRRSVLLLAAVALLLVAAVQPVDAAAAFRPCESPAAFRPVDIQSSTATPASTASDSADSSSPSMPAKEQELTSAVTNVARGGDIDLSEPLFREGQKGGGPISAIRNVAEVAGLAIVMAAGQCGWIAVGKALALLATSRD